MTIDVRNRLSLNAPRNCVVNSGRKRRVRTRWSASCIRMRGDAAAAGNSLRRCSGCGCGGKGREQRMVASLTVRRYDFAGYGGTEETAQSMRIAETRMRQPFLQLPKRF